jgi:signal transduction histidine kinase
MSEDTKAMLFGNGGRTSILGTNMEKGSGLGLLLVKDFIAAHGGTISVDTEVDKGTCFRFTLPHFTEQPEL